MFIYSHYIQIFEHRQPKILIFGIKGEILYSQSKQFDHSSL